MGTTNMPPEVECKECNGAGTVTPDHPGDRAARAWRCENCNGYGMHLECPECRNAVGGDIEWACGREDDIYREHSEAVAHGWAESVKRYERSLEDIESIRTFGACVECDDERRAIAARRAATFGEVADRLEVCMVCSCNIRNGQPTVAVRATNTAGSAAHDRRICAPCADRIWDAIGNVREQLDSAGKAVA